MKVELLVSRSGPSGAWNSGDVIDVDEEEAKRLFEADPPQAKPVHRSRKKETTTAS